MDEFFEGFLRDFGPGFDRVYVPQSSMERYRGRLPDQLLRYWDEFGWCGYANGLFWTVDPHEYAPATQAWIGNTPFEQRDVYHVIARGAFGKLYLWGEQSGPTLLLSPIPSYAIPLKSSTTSSLDKRLQMFFGFQDKEQSDLDGNFALALKRLGRLTKDEMYGLVPALALGGALKVDNMQKVRVVEHLVFLSQLSELQVIVGPAS